MPFDDRIPEENEDLRPKWEAFCTFVDMISGRLRDQDAETELAVAAMDGKPIGRVVMADVRRKFDNITWRLTTVDPHSGGVGAVTSFYKTGSKPSAWERGEAAFMTTGFRGYGALQDNQGLFYLALHETAHVTLLGLRVQGACWRKHLKGGGAPDAYADTPPFIYNEQVANEIVRVLATQIDVEVLANPTHGSPPTPLKLGLKTA